MTLRELRELAGLSQADVAQRMAIKVEDVETIETEPLRLLEVSSVTEYVQALGSDLELTAVSKTGERTVLV